MICPACGEVLTTDQDRCLFCGGVVSPPSEGALAPLPRTVTPPPPAKVEPLRELPGVRPRERTWRDEVSERVQHRRRKRAGLPELPLFDNVEEPRVLQKQDAVAEPAPQLRELGRPDRLESPTADLPLRAAAPPALPDEAPVEIPDRDVPVSAREETIWVEAKAHPAEIRSERPALFVERVRAATVDVLLVAGMWAVVIYFAGRAARVPVLGLRPNWPYLAAYLVFLGLVYAAYFTGTTGQTPGKMATGLRVVDATGQPPGYLRALVRAALGAVSALAAGAGLIPMLFDPARRAVHDRLFRTRVVRG